MNRALRLVRTCLFALLGLAPGALAYAKSDTKAGPLPQYVAEILERSLSELRRRGENPDDFTIDLMNHLPAGMLQYLEFRKVKDTSGVWAVQFLPKPREPRDIPEGHLDVITFGGDYVFFFRHPSGREFEVWLGE